MCVCVTGCIKSIMVATLLALSGLWSVAQANDAPESAEDRAHTHRIQPGDTLDEIAALYGTSIVLLVQQNNIVDPDRIQVGQELLLRAHTDIDTSLVTATADLVRPVTSSRAHNDGIHRVVLPLRFNQRTLGYLTVDSSVERLHSVDGEAALELLSPFLKPDVFAEISSHLNSLRPLDMFETYGIDLTLDPVLLAVVANIASESFAPNANIGVSGPNDAGSEAIVEPGGYAAGLSMSLRLRGQVDAPDATTIDSDWRGFFALGGRDGVSVTASGRSVLRDSDARFVRGRILALKDWPEQALQLSAGDLLPNMPALAGAPQMLGLSLQRNYANLQPEGGLSRPVWDAVILERPADITVRREGVLIERFQAAAGRLDLRRLNRLANSGILDVEIEDSFGRRAVIPTFTAGYSGALPVDVSEFSLSIGALRKPVGGAFDYGDTLALLGRYERGVSRGATVSGHVAVSDQKWNAGGGVNLNTRIGRIGARMVTSGGENRPSAYGARASVSASPRVLPGDRLLVEIEALEDGFQRFNDFEAYSAARTLMSVSYGGSVRPDLSVYFNWVQTSDDSALQLATTSSSLTVTGRIGRGYLMSLGARHEARSTGDQTGVFFRVSRSWGQRGFSASHDTATARSRALYQARPDLAAYGRFDRISIDRGPASDRLSGDLRLTSSRGEVQFSGYQHWRQNAVDRTRYSAQIRSGIAITNGRWGIAANPGDGFILFDRSTGAGDSHLQVRRSSAGPVLARSGVLGAAVISSRAAHRVETYLIELQGPEGLDGLGEPIVQVRSGTTTGLAYVAVNSNTTSLDFVAMREGEPVVLERGTLECDGADLPFFTNRNGRAFVMGLGVGACVIRFGYGPEKAIEIPSDAGALLRLGDLEFGDENA